MTTFADATAAVDHLVELDDRGQLPFTWYLIGPRDGRVDVAVPDHDLAVARGYFVGHPMRRPDGASIPIDVRPLAGASWVSEPVHRNAHPDPAALEGLVGLDVGEAARRANAGGWVVRAHEPGAALTAELRTDRANLRFSGAGTVDSVRVG